MESTPTAQPIEQQSAPPPPSPSPTQPSSSSLPLSSSFLHPSTPSSPALTSSSNPNASPRLPFNRPWPQSSPYPSNFSSHLHSSSPSPPPVPPFSSSAPPLPPPAQKGGMTLGVPAHHPSPSLPQPSSFSSLNPPSFGQQFGGLARNSGNVTESGMTPGTSQVRQPIQGIQGMGTVGSFGSGPQMRPSGIVGHHQQRPVQSSARPQTTQINQSPNSQNFQGHGIRVPSVGSPGLSSPSASQSVQLQNQPWLSSGSQGKPPLPSPPVRSITNMLSLQQRSHIPQQHHRSTSTASQQPQLSSSQQQPLPSHLPQEHYGQHPNSRDPQSLLHQQHIPKGAGLGHQKGSSHTVVHPSPVQSVPPNRTLSADSGEYCNRILSKRSIQELVTQIDPSERLDPEVEDILADIADDFVDSITTFGCSLAKHRKSNTLEAKDILLHLERNWNMTLPGFSGDEIKIYRKPFSSEIHRERLAVIRRSVASTDTPNTRSSAGQAAGNAKSHIPKAQLNVVGSPNPKIREAA